MREVCFSEGSNATHAKRALDLDPEGDDVSEDSHGSEGSSDDETESNGGRAHYAEVGKSKLRKPKEAALGPQYRGSRISRDDAEDEDEDDPFGRGFEDDGSDEEHVNGGVMNGTDERSSGEDQDAGSGDSDAEEDGITAAPRPTELVSAAQRDEMRKAARADQKVVASTISQSVKNEAEKGRAVKKQRATFDALLGARIKLQKSIVASNTILGLKEEDLARQLEGGQDAMEAAETAAFNLWSALNDFREELNGARTGEKRKRGGIAKDSSVEDLWSHMQQHEEANLPHRNVVLQRWSAKTRDPSVRAQGALVRKSDQTPIIDCLQQYLTSSDHLLRKAHTPRSCAPLQVERKLNEDAKIYDDADFYGLMLKELLESKSSDSLTASAIDFDPRKEAKTKKHVDTKASKGRKLRYTVHEKLENFMAPEDRRRWGDRQADELFGSLFGRTLALGEDVGMDEEADGGADGSEAEDLVLFRT